MEENLTEIEVVNLNKVDGLIEHTSEMLVLEEVGDSVQDVEFLVGEDKGEDTGDNSNDGGDDVSHQKVNWSNGIAFLLGESVSKEI